jgi:hypothetical protein
VVICEHGKVVKSYLGNLCGCKDRARPIASVRKSIVGQIKNTSSPVKNCHTTLPQGS